ncbi:MAG: NAD(P)/FAD-dependent oxidoreductase [Limnohabitans sp.]|nr:NAD(P)/FAD-dependent oxidoreductase [Limnohabitans sp.]
MLDLLIIGAGLSGIGAARHLQTHCPDKRWRIWEARKAIGGTWDLFRYPGVRSDSDMHTLGYAFKPWRSTQAMADGPSILQYIRDAAEETGVSQQIDFQHRVVRADWSSKQACWRVNAQLADSSTRTQETRFLYMCGGYYSYAQGHQPHFDGQDDFTGQLVYPQFWPGGLSYVGKRVVVIGSGATAMTIVPAMTKDAAHVTLLQRSPSYVVTRPAQEALGEKLDRWLPFNLGYRYVRWRNILQGIFYFQLARRKPLFFKNYLIGMVKKALERDFDVATHFTPRYHPWDQRVCALPDGDLFKQIRGGKVSVATGQIARFDADGINLQDGTSLPADIVVVATGLQLNVLADVAIHVDGKPFVAGHALAYKGMMLSGLPNLAVAFGYTNASWTLKADLTASYVCRLLTYMDRRGYRFVCPQHDPSQTTQAFLDFTSGYVQRASAMLPKQGAAPPWRVHQNYVIDVLALRFGGFEDGVLVFQS